MEKHPLHLKNPELQTSPDVQKAVAKRERLTGERVPNNPFERIEVFMSRLEKVFLHPDKEKRERNIEMLRPRIYDALIIKKEDFPESYFELQMRVARERGQAVESIPPQVREQMMDTAIQDQKASLDAWIDYLSSDDAVYPPWFKFYVWQNVTKLSQFDKERGEYKKRSESTVALFPDIYREPLAQIADVYEKVKQDNKNLAEPEIKSAFSKKFPALYAELTSRSLAATMERSEQIKGKWVKYQQGNQKDADKLFESLDGKGTGWCTAGKSTAQAQINSGDFYVYYTEDDKGNPVQPRLAIRMDGTDKIGEVRGVLPHQEVEPLLQDTLDEKLKDFGSEADAYRKKSADMKRLTAIEKKVEAEQKMTKDDLVFLYEINSSIDGFGYQKDPRIKELRSRRNQENDMLTIFECTKDQIAHVPSDIDQDTKAYVGQLEPGIFDKLAKFNIEHVFTSFPEGRIRFMPIEIGGKTVKEYKQELETQGHKLTEWAKDILAKTGTSERRQEIQIVRLSVKDLGFSSATRYDKIQERARELGLDLAPAETGPALRLSMKNQAMDDWFLVGMEALSDRDGDPDLFNLERDADGPWLNTDYGIPDSLWHPDHEFAFALRKH